MERSDAERNVDSAIDDPKRRGARIRLAALLAALATAVAAFGALVLPRVATDGSGVPEQAGAPPYAVVVEYEYGTSDRVGGCERDDTSVTGDPAQQT